MNNKPVQLSEIVEKYMAQADVKDQRLAQKVNKLFPELEMSRSTIRNWRTGDAQTVRDWRPFVAMLAALGVNEVDADAALTAGGQSTIQVLAATAVPADQKYLAHWLNAANNGHVVSTSNSPVAGSGTPLLEPAPKAAKLGWLIVGVTGAIALLALVFLLWQRSDFASTTTETTTPTLLPTTAEEVVFIPTIAPTQVPTVVPLPYNNSFESEADIEQWGVRGNCDLQKELDAKVPDGANALLVKAAEDGCASIYKDIPISSVADETYSVSVWLYSPAETATTARLVIWGMAEDNINPSGQDVVVYNAWHCYEVQHQVKANEINRLRAEIYFDPQAELFVLLDNLAITPGETTHCPAQPPPPLLNHGFESETFAPWLGLNNCDLVLNTVPRIAREGSRVLDLFKRTQESCDGVFNGVTGQVLEGETYRFRAWLRHPVAAEWSGELVLRGSEGSLDLVPFTVSGSSDWLCMETAVTFPKTHDMVELTAEIRFHTPHEFAYQIDDTLLIKSDALLCPQPELSILAEIGSMGPNYPGGTLSVLATVANHSQAPAPSSVIQGWIASQENGLPIDPGALAERAIPALTMGTTSELLNLEILASIGLEPGDYFVVLQTRPDTHYPDGEEPRAFLSLPFTIEPCLEGTLFCDVPLDHWAWPEIQIWYATGMTKGCRGGTEEYNNRPFCPGVILDRVHFLALLLRHLYGGDFAPPSKDDVPYVGYYADVSSEHSWMPWIEEAYRLGIELPQPSCLSTEGARRFCPEVPMSRTDFVLQLANLLDWPLEPVTETPFIDVPADHPAAEALVYMWQQGFIPEFEPDCLNGEDGLRFCPEAPIRRANAAVFMVEIFALEAEAEP